MQVVEKFEDIVRVVFLPLVRPKPSTSVFAASLGLSALTWCLALVSALQYFTLSGLKTNIASINSVQVRRDACSSQLVPNLLA